MAGGTLFKPGWPEHYYEAVACKNGRFDDGSLVLVDFHRQLHRRANYSAFRSWNAGSVDASIRDLCRDYTRCGLVTYSAHTFD